MANLSPMTPEGLNVSPSPLKMFGRGQPSLPQQVRIGNNLEIVPSQMNLYNNLDLPRDQLAKTNVTSIYF